MRFCKSGICTSSPLISLFAISRKKTPDLHEGSRNVVSGLLKSSCGSISSIALATSGGVKTSSFDKFARQDNTSGVYTLSKRFSVIFIPHSPDFPVMDIVICLDRFRNRFICFRVNHPIISTHCIISK